MKLAQQLAEYVRACFTGLWIESHEHEDALHEIAQLCREQAWQLATWDIEQGLQIAADQATNEATDPLAAVRALPSLAPPKGTALLVLSNFHRFLQSAEIVQALARQIHLGKQQRTFIVVLSPIVDIPPELEKVFVVLEHELPDREQLNEIAQGIATEPGELPEQIDHVLDAAAGLTRFEAEGAFALSLVRDGQVAPHSIWQIKSQQLKKSGLVALHEGEESFSSLGGLESLKRFCLRALRRQSGSKCRPRGILLLSPPGCGKSQFAKALGHEVGRPTLTLDIGSLMGSLVGQTEDRTRQALKVADAMAPCILFCDEIEKGLSGAASSGQTDSGVTARLFGSLLTWLNDHASDVFFVATCNDISKLPAEFTRAERFDGVFFVDLPSAEQRQMIWDIYLAIYDIEPEQKRPHDENWTGAEIRSCCRLAALLDLPLTAAAQHVVPIAVTAAESVERLRNWAGGRCLDAELGGIYRPEEKTNNKRRRVRIDPSMN